MAKASGSGWHRGAAAPAREVSAGRAGSIGAAIWGVPPAPSERSARRLSRPTAAHVAALVEQYEEHVRRLVANRADLQLHARVADELDQIRRHCAGVPELSMPWVMLLIAHAELVHSLWQGRTAGAPAGADREHRLQNVVAPAPQLRRSCLKLAA
jgi:hypothetical protein